MLRSLYIRNYALIEEFTVHFGRGLNIITGETGAGKSIVLGAFGLLIGERASAELIRHGADKAVVEAEFEMAGNPRLADFLREKEFDVLPEALVIRREVSQRGTSRGFINDSPASTQLLKELGEYLVDLHGQHEHQSLLHAQHHIRMLDEFGGLLPELHRFQTHRASVLALAAEIAELRERERRLREEHDLFEFQLQEIMAVDPEPDEDARIEKELLVLENAEELRDAASSVHDLLYEADGSAFEKLGVVKELLSKLQSIDPALTEPLAEARSALAIVQELSNWMHRYAGRVELDPERLRHLRDRAQRILRLKKKFGGTMETLLERKAELTSKLQFEEEFDEILRDRSRALEGRRKELAEIATALSRSRAEIGRALGPQIVEVLKDLGIENAAFEVQIEQRGAPQNTPQDDPHALRIGDRSVAINANGIDDVEFYLSTNAGERPKPLAKVASGGEISRVMLALKTILAKNDKLPLLVFDEIDIGISGRVAQRVGRAMKLLARDHQIISITHLAQIAAYGDAHFLAEKSSSSGVTTSRLRQLTATEHEEEVARIISGASLSQSSLENARALIAEAVAALAEAQSMMAQPATAQPTGGGPASPKGKRTAAKV